MSKAQYNAMKHAIAVKIQFSIVTFSKGNFAFNYKFPVPKGTNKKSWYANTSGYKGSQELYWPLVKIRLKKLLLVEAV